MDKINNIDDLTTLLNETALEVKSESVSINKAKAIAQIAGRVLEGKRITLEYQKVRGKKPNIPFLGNQISESVKK